MMQIRAKILVVEDDANQLKMLENKLQSENFEVRTATNGEEGLKKAFEYTPDLIIADILMPEMDGLTMLQKLRQQGDYGKSVPVILLTNLSADEEDIIRKVAETGPAYYLVKPSLTLNQVVEKVKERLSRR